MERKIKTGKVRKSEIRKEIFNKLNCQSEYERIKKSLKIKEKLFLSREFNSANCIMFYVSINGEVDTVSMIDGALKLGKKVVVPVILPMKKKLIASVICDQSKELSIGPYGIPQPKPSVVKEVLLEEIELVVVPGLAFDREGNRIGRGEGYYDRFLVKLAHRQIPLIGLAFDFQVVKKVPSLSHDIPVTKIITA